MWLQREDRQRRGYHIDGSIEVGNVRIHVEESPTGDGAVGEKILACRQLVGRDRSGDITTNHQSGHGNVATEEVVGDREDAKPLAAEGFETGRTSANTLAP